MYTCRTRPVFAGPYRNEHFCDPVVVTPCRTRKQARALAKVANKHPIARLALVSDTLHRVAYFPQADYEQRAATAILNALGYTHE